MEQPLVCCMLLAHNRPEMARRAIESFRSQTYARKRLLVLDNGWPLLRWDRRSPVEELVCISQSTRRSIGLLRNAANDLSEGADIIAHWDDDDWSHPQRLEEQVQFLQSSGADAVGYSDLLFWRDPEPRINFTTDPEAWLYVRNGHYTVPGTSLLYWRKAWQQKRFEDLPKPGSDVSEDVVWQSGLKVAAAGSFYAEVGTDPTLMTPRMIASIHGANTQSYAAVGFAPEFMRAPFWDEYCRERMV